MSKKRILWNMIGACIVTWVGLGFLIPTLVSVEWVCQRTGVSGITCQARPESLGPGFTTAMVFFGVAGILGLVAWIGALVRTIKMRDWVWMVLLIAGSGIATLIYALVGRDQQPTTMAYPPPSHAAPLPPPERTPTPVG
jgi:hypothetical protein